MLYVPGSLTSAGCERIHGPLVPVNMSYWVSSVKIGMRYIGEHHQDDLNPEKITAITNRIEEILTDF
jgi:hypothetical protein